MNDDFKLSVTCADCGEVSTITEVNRDEVRFHTEDGVCVRFGEGATQALINGSRFYCECCAEEYQ
jgi:hypothetical protein